MIHNAAASISVRKRRSSGEEGGPEGIIPETGEDRVQAKDQVLYLRLLATFIVVFAWHLRSAKCLDFRKGCMDCGRRLDLLAGAFR